MVSWAVGTRSGKGTLDAALESPSSITLFILRANRESMMVAEAARFSKRGHLASAGTAASEQPFRQRHWPELAGNRSSSFGPGASNHRLDISSRRLVTSGSPPPSRTKHESNSYSVACAESEYPVAANITRIRAAEGISPWVIAAQRGGDCTLDYRRLCITVRRILKPRATCNFQHPVRGRQRHGNDPNVCFHRSADVRDDRRRDRRQDV
jgi:hypothetical protein